MNMDTSMNDKAMAKVAKALGDRNRLLIFRELADRGSMYMSEAIQLTHLAQPSVSFHVKQLVNAEIVVSEKHGRDVHLSINQSKLEEFNTTLAQIKAISLNLSSE